MSGAESIAVQPPPLLAQLSALHRFRIRVHVVGLVLTNLIAHFTTSWAGAGYALRAAVAGVVLAVLTTAAAGLVFSWLRRRSGSLIAPIALHWSLNGFGALAAALAWQMS